MGASAVNVSPQDPGGAQELACADLLQRINGRACVLPCCCDDGVRRGPMRVQLGSYNYDPEPTGIGPVSTVLARGLRRRGPQVDVVAAHPHYPSPMWGKRAKPYREIRDGVRVLRLPLWIGRDSAVERYRQELTFM